MSGDPIDRMKRSLVNARYDKADGWPKSFPLFQPPWLWLRDLYRRMTR